MIKSYAIKIPINSAQHFTLINETFNILDTTLKIKKNKNFIYFPIKKDKFEKTQVNNLLKLKINNFSIIKDNFEEYQKKVKTYKDNLKLSNNLKKYLPTSYDIIGNIVLIKLPDELMDYKKNIGESILQSKKNIKTVCLVKPISGELRTRDIEIISGENRTKTKHKEFGLEFFVDIKDSYFSPRLANERKRIATLVKPDEIVVDMFTGVGPFAIMIAKYSKAKIIYAIDKNKKAILLAQQNVKINKVVEKITLYNKDSKDISKILEKEKKVADRIIMNLPFSSQNFFTNALDIISKKCDIHLYTIIKEKEIKNLIDKLKNISRLRNINFKSYKINKIKSYSPREFYMGFDITVKKQ
jgi:tRNA (guanine37-N1)-methyltransferase